MNLLRRLWCSICSRHSQLTYEQMLALYEWDAPVGDLADFENFKTLCKTLGIEVSQASQTAGSMKGE